MKSFQRSNFLPKQKILNNKIIKESMRPIKYSQKVKKEDAKLSRSEKKNLMKETKKELRIK